MTNDTTSVTAEDTRPITAKDTAKAIRQEAKKREKRGRPTTFHTYFEITGNSKPLTEEDALNHQKTIMEIRKNSVRRFVENTKHHVQHL